MAETIELAEAKLHCRIDGDDEDLLIQAYIDAAL
ncbi:phage gp6-like head-tail connector protein, partial [Klebsiella pneumoniae]|nr:phage gp6-like head-tail connector protein [Klebsiella pneumoniae]